MRTKTENWVKTNCKSLLLISCNDMATKLAAVKVVDLVAAVKVVDLAAAVKVVDLAAAEKVDLVDLVDLVADAVVLVLGAVVLVLAALNDLVVLTHNLRVLFEMRPSSFRVDVGDD